TTRARVLPLDSCRVGTARDPPARARWARRAARHAPVARRRVLRGRDRSRTRLLLRAVARGGTDRVARRVGGLRPRCRSAAGDGAAPVVERSPWWVLLPSTRSTACVARHAPEA